MIGEQLLPPGKALVGNSLRIEVGRRGGARVLEVGESTGQPTVLDIWARWDSNWYLAIASNGYDLGQLAGRLPKEYQPADSSGFFPLYPLLIRFLRPVFGGIGAGILISNVFLLLSVFCLLQISIQLWGPERGGQIGFGAGLALLLWPYTLFFSAVYSESLFLFLSAAAFLSSLRRQDGRVVVLASLATLTRPFGLALALPLLMQWWPDREKRPMGWFVLPSMLLAISLLMLSSFGLFGDALAFVHRQSRWRGPSIFPAYAFVRWFREGPTIHGAGTSCIEAMVAMVLLAFLVLAFKKIPPSLALYSAVGLAIPLSSTLWSFGRISSNLFPLYLLLGFIWVERRPWARVLFGLSAMLALVAMFFFGAGWWVG